LTFLSGLVSFSDDFRRLSRMFIPGLRVPATTLFRIFSWVSRELSQEKIGPPLLSLFRS